MPKHVLSIDIETYSPVDLTRAGVYRYVEDPDFRLLLFAYSLDGAPARIVDLESGEELPASMLRALFHPDIIKSAFNAQFERVCLSQYLGEGWLPPEQWECTQILAQSYGLPGSLAGAAKILQLPEQKSDGARLIKLFCKPQTTGKLVGKRITPAEDPTAWQGFKDYCLQDVTTEVAIRKALSAHQLTETDQRLWVVDQQMNDRGIRVDQTLVSHAIACAAEYEAATLGQAIELTGLDNPKSVAQLKRWLASRGIEVDSLDKSSVAELMDSTTDETVKDVLTLRQQLSKSSVAKYDAIARSVNTDGRLRGLLRMYGAARSGRWAGRGVQVQNLPKTAMPDLDSARSLLRSGDYASLGVLYDSVPDVLSQLLRTAFIPSKGRSLVVADYSAIEARIIAWLADEQWRLDVFRGDGRIYEASASRMFGVPVEEIYKGHPLRQKGKVAELACGYGGGVGALTAMGALKMGLSESDLSEIISSWRSANSAIVSLWDELDSAAQTAIRDLTSVKLRHGLSCGYAGNALTITIPSGRLLVYQRARIEIDTKYGKPCITYEGRDAGGWGRVQTRGPKLVENVVQAIARDCLAEALLRVADAGYATVMHVHDEVVCEVPAETADQVLHIICALISDEMPWAPTLPLNAEGFVCKYYQKD